MEFVFTKNAKFCFLHFLLMQVSIWLATNPIKIKPNTVSRKRTKVVWVTFRLQYLIKTLT